METYINQVKEAYFAKLQWKHIFSYDVQRIWRGVVCVDGLGDWGIFKYHVY